MKSPPNTTSFEWKFSPTQEQRWYGGPGKPRRLTREENDALPYGQRQDHYEDDESTPEPRYYG